MASPSEVVKSYFTAPSIRRIRRCEIYEQDGTTLFDREAKITAGSITVDSSRDERRSVDITLSNADGKYKHAPAGLWYDKIFKIYHGISWDEPVDTPIYKTRSNYGSIWTWGSNAGTGGTAAQSDVPTGGQDNGRYRRLTWSVASTAIANSGLFVGSSTVDLIPVVVGQILSISGYVRTSVAQRMYAGFNFYDAAGVATTSAGTAIVTVANTWTRVSYNNVVVPANAVRAIGLFYTPASGTGARTWPIGATLDVNQPLIEFASSAGTYFDGDTADTSVSTRSWTGTVGASISQERTLTSISRTMEERTWETQIGEFMVDSMATQSWPKSVSVVGRDYTAKLLSSGLKTSVTFTATDDLEGVIRSLVINGRLNPNKMILPQTGITLGRDFFFDQGTSRWEAIKQLAEPFGYEVYFDAYGFFVMRAYRDPVSSPIAYTFRTGPRRGTVASWDKRTGRTEMYNIIIVAGEATETIPVSARAENHSPTSPTSIENLNIESLLMYVAASITTVAQAQELANKLLKIYSLEEYDLNLSTVLLPWLEAGDIIEFLDEDDDDEDDPTRFLLSSFTIPMELGLMSPTGKRVTIVG